MFCNMKLVLNNYSFGMAQSNVAQLFSELINNSITAVYSDSILMRK